MSTEPVTLRAGRCVDGVVERDAELRAPTGVDEAFLLEEGAGLTPAARTTELLARCLVRLGSTTSVSREDVRELTAGDREALLLHIRRLVAGERIDAVVTCPEETCREALELELRVGDLLISTPEAVSETHDLDLGAGRRLRFRLLTGGDLEAVAELAATDVAAAAAAALRRCVDGPLEPEAEAALDAELARLDPQAEILLELTCPACGSAFTSGFDAAEFLRRELVPRPDDLYREVQLLAATCHWSEADILALTARRRRAYCAALGGTTAEDAT